MERKALRSCLTMISAVKKNLILSEAVEDAWYYALIDLSDDEGTEAFKKLLGTVTYGDPEPGHVLEIAQQCRQTPSINLDNYPWIRDARDYKGDKWRTNTEAYSEYLAWIELELQKDYRATDSEGRIFLVKNPYARRFYIRPGAVWPTFIEERRKLVHEPGKQPRGKEKRGQGNGWGRSGQNRR